MILVPVKGGQPGELLKAYSHMTGIRERDPQRLADVGRSGVRLVLSIISNCKTISTVSAA